MNKKKIPVVLGLIILVIGIASGVLLLQSKQIFHAGASADYAPKNVRITNISDTSFSVSWITEKESENFIKWGESQGSLDKVEKDQITPGSFTHYVTVKNLSPNKNYFFLINSRGSDFDNNGAIWQTKTGQPLNPQSSSILASGSLLTASGVPSPHSLIYIQISGYLHSTVTSDNGNWVIPLTSARTSNLASYLSINPTTTLLAISVDAGPGGTASANIYPQSANPTPPIVLGKSYDFRNLPPNNSPEVPRANVNLSQEGSQETSGFNVPDEPIASHVKSVTIDSTKEAEIVSSVKPEFFGGGPSGTTINITLHSETVTGSVKVSDRGTWDWTPPKSLSEGTHSITLSWKDAGGVVRSLTRNFIVQAAASDTPAFVSTPSASLTPTPRPSPTPTSTATPRPTAVPTPTPTSPPTPVSGSLTPTLLLFIMGIGVVLFSVLVWRGSEI